jgi:hypothetical protein
MLFINIFGNGRWQGDSPLCSRKLLFPRQLSEENREPQRSYGVPAFSTCRYPAVRPTAISRFRLNPYRQPSQPSQNTYDPKVIHAYFSQVPAPATVTMESTRTGYWLYELLEEYRDVKLANPRKVRLIVETKVKTDKIEIAGREFLASFELRPIYRRALDGYMQFAALSCFHDGSSFSVRARCTARDSLRMQA